MQKPKLEKLTLREKIGQMLLPYQNHVYFENNGTNSDTMRSEDEVRRYIEKEQFGSYWMEQTSVHKLQNPDLTEKSLDGVNSEQYKIFIDKQDSYGKIPAFMAIDAETEGAGHIFSDLSVVCRPLAVGATDSEELSYELGVCIGKELRCAGANWRWAPAADVSHKLAIGSMRSFFPDNPDRLIKIANAHIRGVQSQGVASTLKHFPGGDRLDYRDSHFSPLVLSSDMNEWWKEQGRIFKGIIDDGVYSVMVGHQAFPACDSSKLKGHYRPATVSKKVVTDLLKGELGFGGVVVTDGIVMAGLTGCYDSYEELIVDLVNAGNDVLLGTYPGAGDIIEQAVKNGKISESRIDDACQRVLTMKEKIGLFEENYHNLPYKACDVVPETKKVNREIARRAVTKVCDKQNLLPVDKRKINHVTIVCSTHTDNFFTDLEYMKQCFEKRGITVRLQRRVANAVEMKEIDETSDLIIYAVYVAPHEPKGFMSLYGEECDTYFYAFTKGKEKSIGLSMGYPHIHFNLMGNADTFINTYGRSPELMEAFVEAVFGEIPIVGKSPVKLYPDDIVLE